MKPIRDINKHLERVEKCRLTSEFCIKIIDSNNTMIKLCPHRCHSYFCPHCSKVKRMKIKEKINSIFEKSRWRFLTLTLDKNLYSELEALNNINYLFNRFWKMCKDNNYRFDYFKISEFTKNNIIHLHILINKFIPKKLINKFWLKISHSPITHIVDIKSSGLLAAYLVKYLSKVSDFNHNLLFYMNNKRRYSYSNNLLNKTPVTDKYTRTYINYNSLQDNIKLLRQFIYYTYGLVTNKLHKFTLIEFDNSINLNYTL